MNCFQVWGKQVFSRIARFGHLYQNSNMCFSTTQHSSSQCVPWGVLAHTPRDVYTRLFTQHCPENPANSTTWTVQLSICTGVAKEMKTAMPWGTVQQIWVGWISVTNRNQVHWPLNESGKLQNGVCCATGLVLKLNTAQTTEINISVGTSLRK